MVALREGSAPTDIPCTSCSGSCCIQGGFALLENVLLAYRVYCDTGLKRADGLFGAGLSLAEFATRYFDPFLIGSGTSRPMMLFHTRTVTRDGELQSWRRVGEFRIDNPRFIAGCTRSGGCVFLNEPFLHWPDEDGHGKRGCLLHDPALRTHLTAKPVQCVMYSCQRWGAGSRHILDPDWLSMLAEAYPESVPRSESVLIPS